MKRLFLSLNIFERCLWLGCVLSILLSSFCFWKGDVLSLIASLVGVTALIFLAKGNWIGQALTVVFAFLYATISYQTAYYGEMITYLCMTAPTAALAAIEWIRHPYQKGKDEVKVAGLDKKKIVTMILLGVITTIAFYFILKALGNASLPLSTLSITTSFCASYLMYVRSPYYAVAYALNDIVLIGLWIVASTSDIGYLPVVVCFVCFFVNDIYVFYNWKRMKKLQATHRKLRNSCKKKKRWYNRGGAKRRRKEKKVPQSIIFRSDINTFKRNDGCE